MHEPINLFSDAFRLTTQEILETCDISSALLYTMQLWLFSLIILCFLFSCLRSLGQAQVIMTTEIYHQGPCRSEPAHLCASSSGACRSKNATAVSSAKCAIMCYKTFCCSGFIFREGVCDMYIGFCTNNILRRVSSWHDLGPNRVANNGCKVIFTNY